MPEYGRSYHPSVMKHAESSTTREQSRQRVSMRLQGFQSLMPYRVREVLLVASRYD
ncbi:MAG: hypothetical protein GY715_20045, partial [Planctomycetes bacterium]|nr:hypothetical protein [Planctomycetota bacterium]